MAWTTHSMRNPKTAVSLGAALTLAACAMTLAGPSLDLEAGTLFSFAMLAGVLVWRTLAFMVQAGPWTPRPRSLAGAALALPAGWGLALLAPSPGRMSFTAIALAVLLTIGLTLSSWDGAAPASAPSHQDDFLVPFLAGLGFYALLLPIRAWARLRFGGDAGSGILLFFMPRQDYQGIPGSPFNQPSQLLWPLLWWGATLLAAARAWRAPTWKGLWAVALMGVLGKLAVATLAASGLRVLPQQVLAPSIAYYQLAQTAQRMGLWEFIHHFNALQPQLGIHGESHPFGPELVYRLLLWGPDASPWVPTLVISALSGLIPLALAGLLRETGLSLRHGLALTLLYGAAPPSTIIANASIECLISLLFAATLWFCVRGLRLGRPAWLALAGLALFLCSLLSIASAYLLLLLVLGGAAAAWTGRLTWTAYLRALARVLGVPLLLHGALALATQGGFNVVDSYLSSLKFQVFNETLPWYLWSWLNPLLFLGYAGAGTLGLVFSAGAARLTGGQRLRLLSLLPLALLCGAWMQGLGLGCSQRIFHWGFAALALLALEAPGHDPEAPGAFRRWAVWATLNAVTSVVMEMTVLDYW